MTINYAVLGILSCNPTTGYDLKKIIQVSPFMYWSGNSNQIYKALMELSDEGYVTNEIQHQEGLPSKKNYTITKEGLEVLKNWVISTPDMIELKKPFLIQLAWSKQLNSNELNKIITDYENQMKMQIMQHNKSVESIEFSPRRTLLERKIWNSIYENIESSYTNELDWIQSLRTVINETENEADRMNLETAQADKGKDNKMKYEVVKKRQLNYVYFHESEIKLDSEKDVLEIISICAENDSKYVLFDGGALSDDFYMLRTGLAGVVLQKFGMYGINTAVYIKKTEKIKGKVKNMLEESNKRGTFKSFASIDNAENWFISLNN